MMACNNCEERRKILAEGLPNVRTAKDLSDLTRKVLGTYDVTKKFKSWASPPSVDKDGRPYRGDITT